MKVISLGLDNKILDKDSAVSKRALIYGKQLSKYHIIVPGDNKEIKLADNILAKGISGHKLIVLYKIYRYLIKLLKKEKFDIITIQDNYYLAFLGVLIAKRFKIKVEIQVHGFEKFKGLRKVIFKYNIKHVDIIRVVSKRLKKQLIKEYNIQDSKIYNIPVYVDIKKIQNGNITTNLKEKYKDYFIFLTVGRLVKVKNIELQLEVLKEIKGKVKLIVLGDGPEKGNLQKIASDNVEFLGWQEDLMSYYKTADCLLLTSDSEGYGMVIAEAISVDLPVIMTDVGCARELVEDNINGFIVNNKEELREKMEFIINNKGLLNKFKENNKKYKKKILSKEELINGIINKWNNIV